MQELIVKKRKDFKRLTAIAVIALAALALSVPIVLSQQPAKRAIVLDDIFKIRSVGDPQISPEGKWVAYTVSTVDAEKDKRDSDIWMVSWDGTQQLRLTSSADSESSPRWSPDGLEPHSIVRRLDHAPCGIGHRDRRGACP